MTDTTDKVAFAAAELIAASDALASAAAEVDALRAEVARQTGIAVDHCARADAAEQMVADLGAIIKEAADDLDCEDKRHAATGDTYDTTYVTETLKRGIAALSRTESVAGRWVPVEQVINALSKVGLALSVHSADTIDAHIKRVREDFDAILTERDAAIAARDEAVARADGLMEERDAAVAVAAEVEEELGAIKEAITQHLPCYVNENDEDDELDAVDTIEEAGRELAHLKATVGSHVSAGTYAKRVDERDAARAALAAAERARDEVGIQLAAAQAEIARMRPVVEAASVVVVHYDDSEQPAWLTKHVEALREAIRVFRAVPGDVLAPVVRGAPFDEAGTVSPDKLTAALEASGIDSANVKGVE